MCQVCKGTKTIQLFTSVIDCDCVSRTTQDIPYECPVIEYDTKSLWLNAFRARDDVYASGDKYWYVNNQN